MLALLIAAEDSLPFIFTFTFGIAILSAIACWRAWGIDMHKHLEAKGTAYDEMHPEEKAEQERREQTGPVGPSH